MSGTGAAPMRRKMSNEFMLRSEHTRILGDAQLRGDLRAYERYKSGYANGVATSLWIGGFICLYLVLGAFNLGLNIQC